MPDSLRLRNDGVAQICRNITENLGSEGKARIYTTDGWRPSWVARLVRPTAANRLHLRYFRQFVGEAHLSHVDHTHLLTDGVYEAESAGEGGEPRLYAFQVKGGSIAWVYSVTHCREMALRRIDKALAELG